MAKFLSNNMKEMKDSGISIGTMIAGLDENNNNSGDLNNLNNKFKPCLYYVDSEGSCVEGDIFCVGSGARLAYAILDSNLDNINISADQSEKIENRKETRCSRTNTEQLYTTHDAVKASARGE